MKTRPLIFRVAAVVSSLTLFAFFVYDRAVGGSGLFYPRTSQATKAQSSATVQTLGAPRMMLPGSKSMPASTEIEALRVPVSPAPQAAAENNAQPTAPNRAPGVNVNLPPPGNEANSQPESPPRTQVLGGSKAGILLLPSDLSAVAPRETGVPAETQTTRRATLPAEPANVRLDQDTSLVGTLPRQQVGSSAPTKTVVAPAVTKPLNNGKPVERREVLIPGSKAPAATLFNGTQKFVNPK